MGDIHVSGCRHDEVVRIAVEFAWARTGCVEVRPVQDIEAVRRRVNDSDSFAARQGRFHPATEGIPRGRSGT